MKLSKSQTKTAAAKLADIASWATYMADRICPLDQNCRPCDVAIATDFTRLSVLAEKIQNAVLNRDKVANDVEF